MIDHKHKIIFIHISKCAGTSIERALGMVNIPVNQPDYEHLYGWDPKNLLFMHHATPKELLEYGLLDRSVWDSYYKFIIIRNPWDRAYSDYVYMLNHLKKYDSFKNFLIGKGVFRQIMTVKDKYYRGDHLNKQKDYFFIDGEEITYDNILKFENLKDQLPTLAENMGLSKDIFSKKENISKTKKFHYSQFYTNAHKALFNSLYEEDIDYLDYNYEDISSLPIQKRFFMPYHFGMKPTLKMYLEFLIK